MQGQSGNTGVSSHKLLIGCRVIRKDGLACNLRERTEDLACKGRQRSHKPHGAADIRSEEAGEGSLGVVADLEEGE